MLRRSAPAPAVDRLVGIAHHAEIAMHFGQPLDQHVLRPVRVLVFVHQHVLELVGVVLPHALGCLEQLHGLQEQVVEVERARFPQRVEIRLVDPAHLLIAQAPAGRAHRIRAFHAVLGLADAAEGRARRNHLVVDVQRLQRLLDDRELIGRVVDDEVARQPDRRRLAAQQPRAQRVECGDPRLAAVLAEQLLHTAPHFFGGLVGEGDRQHLIRRGEPRADDVADADGDDPRLAGTCARKDQQRPLG